MAAVSETIVLIIAVAVVCFLLLITIQYRFIIYRLSKHVNRSYRIPFYKIRKKIFKTVTMKKLKSSFSLYSLRDKWLCDASDQRISTSWQTNNKKGKGKESATYLPALVVDKIWGLRRKIEPFCDQIDVDEYKDMDEWLRALARTYPGLSEEISVLKEAYEEARFGNGVVTKWTRARAARERLMNFVGTGI